ncbi:hypothetical protein FHP05_05485 [Cerasibacillus terrae]|uniref:Uncharacterized protein n=1 Tax=Cerasibacillus terrae TaxID=2498845 RepID=A0A5C8P0J8_9BACI|nr:hypothetical protein [Cerasibacillus terrae]TXL66823.1 hypothetical protein FHP05_05485 [Cerasibacillus terrae]
MKKFLLSSMLLMLISFSLYIGPSEEMRQSSFDFTDEPAISTVYTMASSDVITQSVQTIIPKWQTEFLFPSTDALYILKGKPIPIKFMNHLFFSRKIAGFICVVQNQTNYLP